MSPASSLSQTEKRQFVAREAYATLSRWGSAKGAVVFDIDDTLINHQESVTQGFEAMVELFDRLSERFVVHVVTARPDDDHALSCACSSKGIRLPVDRLHMMPTVDYYNDRDRSLVEQFKWRMHQTIVRARPGRRALRRPAWDAATTASLDTYLRHIEHRDTYVFDPALATPDGAPCLSAKLPGSVSAPRDGAFVASSRSRSADVAPGVARGSCTPPPASRRPWRCKPGPPPSSSRRRRLRNAVRAPPTSSAGRRAR